MTTCSMWQLAPVYPILWYLLELLDPFIKNESSVLPILIEKNFEQKIFLCLLKMRSIFFKEGKSNFSIKLGQRLLKSFSQLHVKNTNFSFPFVSFRTKLWPTAYAILSDCINFWHKVVSNLKEQNCHLTFSVA